MNHVNKVQFGLAFAATYSLGRPSTEGWRSVGVRARPGSWNISEGCFYTGPRQLSYAWLLDKKRILPASLYSAPSEATETGGHWKGLRPLIYKGPRAPLLTYKSSGGAKSRECDL